MQLGAWVGVQLQGLVSNPRPKNCLLLMYVLLTQTVSDVLANWSDEQLLIIMISTHYPQILVEHNA